MPSTLSHRHYSMPTAFLRTTTIDIQFTMFNDVQGVSISGDALNVVHGDQYNGATTIVNRIVRVERPGRTVVKERKRHDTDSEYNQYREIIRGDINKFEQLSSEDDWDWEWKDGKVVWTHFYRRTVHKAHVYGDDKVYTAISYHGRDAKKIWKKEFTRCSQADDSAVLLRLFAINRSNVLTLLFHDEWLPLGFLYSKAEGTFWESYYLEVYTGAWWDKIMPGHGGLWLNSRTGRISSGPRGPRAISHKLDLYNSEDMPPVMEMATADTCVRFFSQTGAGHLDFDVLEYASYKEYSRICIESLSGIDSPDCQDHGIWIWKRDTRRGLWFCNECDRTSCDEVQDLISKLRLDTIYSGVQLDKIAILKEGSAYAWKSWSNGHALLIDQTLVDSGLTRFQFDVGSQGTSNHSYIHLDTVSTVYTWLSQAHRFDLPPSGPETCCPKLFLELRLDLPEQFGVLDMEPLPIVYLFLRPPPLDVADIDSWLSQISFWSFDENGTSEISETECKRLGLPNIYLDCVYLRLCTWPKYVYDSLHAWQIARGFDPTTTELARSLGMPIFEPATTRFEEVVEEDPLTCNSPPEPNANSILDDPPVSNQLSPPAPRIPSKRKRVQVVTIHDTDSESEPEPESIDRSRQPSTPNRKRVKMIA